MNKIHNFLSSWFVFGIDFHRWLLGEPMQRDFKLLLDRNELLLAVTGKSYVSAIRTEASLLQKWEQFFVQTPRFNFLLNSRWGAVASLNLDAYCLFNNNLISNPLPKISRDRPEVDINRGLFASALLRINNRVQFQCDNSITRSFWFSNGFVGKLEPCQCVLRRFGFQLVTLYKAWLDLWWLIVKCTSNLAGVPLECHSSEAVLVKDDNPRLPIFRTKTCDFVQMNYPTWHKGLGHVAA